MNRRRRWNYDSNNLLNIIFPYIGKQFSFPAESRVVLLFKIAVPSNGKVLTSPLLELIPPMLPLIVFSMKVRQSADALRGDVKVTG